MARIAGWKAFLVVQFILLGIRLYAEIQHIQHQYALQNEEKTCAELVTRKQALEQEYATLFNKNSIACYARGPLHMTTVNLRQIKKVYKHA